MASGGNGQGKGKNGIGSGAGKPGGKKPDVTDGGAYLDANSAPAGNKNLNRATQDAHVSNDDFNRLYAPDGSMNNTRVTGKRGEKGKEIVQFIKGAPDRADSKVPYYEVYGNYAPAAENAMNREDIPANYKKQVKEYFDAIRPGSKPSSSGNAAKPGGK